MPVRRVPTPGRRPRPRNTRRRRTSRTRPGRSSRPAETTRRHARGLSRASFRRRRPAPHGSVGPRRRTRVRRRRPARSGRPPGKRLPPQFQRTFFGTATPTVAVPAALARNIGQSSRAAGTFGGGRSPAGEDDGSAPDGRRPVPAAAGPWRTCRGPASNRTPTASNTNARWPAPPRRNTPAARRLRSRPACGRRCRRTRSCPRRRRADRRTGWASPSTACTSRSRPAETRREPCRSRVELPAGRRRGRHARHDVQRVARRRTDAATRRSRSTADRPSPDRRQSSCETAARRCTPRRRWPACNSRWPNPVPSPAV